MASTYRVIYFVPDPMLNGRIPVAAALGRDNDVRFVRAQFMPDAQCLGGEEVATVLDLMLNQLPTRLLSLSEQAFIGQHGEVGELREFPSGVGDASEWLRAHVLPRATAPHQRSGRRNPTRATRGMAYFKSRQVHHMVKKTYDPRGESGAWLRADAIGILEQVSHFVRGTRRLLLMEPIAPTEDERKLDNDIRKVSGRLSMYRAAELPEGQWQQLEEVQLIAYVLSGGSSSARTRALSALHQFTDDVIDTARTSHSRRFTDNIKAVHAEQYRH